MTISIEADYKRFCGLHSWYKHIPLSGKDFYVYQSQGDQPRNGVCPQVMDTVGMHWHFSTREPDAPSVLVRFGPFLRGIEGYDDMRDDMRDLPITRGFNIIVSDAGSDWLPWIETNYPHLAHVDWRSPSVEWKEPRAVEELYKNECARYWRHLTHNISSHMCK